MAITTPESTYNINETQFFSENEMQKFTFTGEKIGRISEQMNVIKEIMQEASRLGIGLKRPEFVYCGKKYSHFSDFYGEYFTSRDKDDPVHINELTKTIETFSFDLQKQFQKANPEGWKDFLNWKNETTQELLKRKEQHYRKLFLLLSRNKDIIRNAGDYFSELNRYEMGDNVVSNVKRRPTGEEINSQYLFFVQRGIEFLNSNVQNYQKVIDRRYLSIPPLAEVVVSDYFTLTDEEKKSPFKQKASFWESCYRVCRMVLELLDVQNKEKTSAIKKTADDTNKNLTAGLEELPHESHEDKTLTDEEKRVLEWKNLVEGEEVLTVDGIDEETQVKKLEDFGFSHELAKNLSNIFRTAGVGSVTLKKGGEPIIS